MVREKERYGIAMQNERDVNQVIKDFPGLFHIRTAKQISEEMQLNSLRDKFKENAEKIRYVFSQIEKAAIEKKNYVVFSPEENISRFVQEFFIFYLYEVEELGDLSVKISW